ncbi:MAG: hypothetical protein DMF64_10375 [Acidobacteria bacterium]|nr:MAG: hypothetical protein DMF64_10375 [Acidobacteriota bacterium]
MRKIAVAFSLFILLALSAIAQGQSAPTLRIVTDDPTLPSDLFYGDIKVKPLRLRPGTNTRITIDDSDFFVQQHYIDFLSRFPEAGGFANWMTFLNSCSAGDAECLHQNRLTTSASFFGSQEFQLKGFYAFRFYRASLARLPTYNEMVADMRSVTGATAADVNQKRAAFATNWVLRGDFIAAFPRSLSPTAFVDNIAQTAGVTLANRTQIISDLTAAGNSDAGRAVALRAIVESNEEYQKEYNPAFVFMQYVGYLRRDPEPAGYNAWLTYLNAHPTDFREMVRGFVDSTEYRNRF